MFYCCESGSVKFQPRKAFLQNFWREGWFRQKSADWALCACNSRASAESEVWLRMRDCRLMETVFLRTASLNTVGSLQKFCRQFHQRRGALQTFEGGNCLDGSTQYVYKTRSMFFRASPEYKKHDTSNDD